MRLAKQSQFIPLQNVVYFIKLYFWFVKYSHFTQMMCYYLNVQFQGQRVNSHHLLIDCMVYVIAGMWWKCVERWKLFESLKEIINATKVILKYIKTQINPSNFWNSECVNQAGIVLERIVLWTIYGPEIQNRQWFVQKSWRMQLKLRVLRIIRLLDRSVFTDNSKEPTVNICRLKQSKMKLFTALHNSASQKTWFFISTAVRNFIFTRL